nr:MAG TPA: hypothetical protein [Caudoviricetes sp.]
MTNGLHCSPAGDAGSISLPGESVRTGPGLAA